MKVWYGKGNRDNRGSMLSDYEQDQMSRCIHVSQQKILTLTQFEASLRKYPFMKNTKTAYRNDDIHDQTGEALQDGRDKFHSVVFYPSNDTREMVSQGKIPSSSLKIEGAGHGICKQLNMSKDLDAKDQFAEDKHKEMNQLIEDMKKPHLKQSVPQLR